MGISSRYRWTEDSYCSAEFPYGEVMTFFKGKEFDVPDGGEEWVRRAIGLGKVEEIEPEEIEPTEEDLDRMTRPHYEQEEIDAA